MRANAFALIKAAAAAMLWLVASESNAGQQAPPLPPRAPLAQLYTPQPAQDISGV